MVLVEDLLEEWPACDELHRPFVEPLILEVLELSSELQLKDFLQTLSDVAV